jgi:hypothetical protein
MRIQASTLLLVCLAAFPLDGTLAWSVTPSSSSTKSAMTTMKTSSSQTNEVSRRQAWDQAFKASAAVIVPVLLPVAAMAYPEEETPRVTTRMGGLLDAFQDGGRGVRLMAPSGWNKFDGEVGAYDIKWQDLVDPSENIKISSTPVKSTTESVQGTLPIHPNAHVDPFTLCDGSLTHKPSRFFLNSNSVGRRTGAR